MKKSSIFVISLIAIGTLSFSFVSNKVEKSGQKQNHAAAAAEAPAGGFALGDQLEN